MLWHSKGVPVLVVLLCLTSGFFFFNSVFAWPKLLAGSLGALAFALLYFEERTRTSWLLASAAMAVALLAHGGVAFSLVPLGIVAVIRRRSFPGLTTLALCLAIFGALYVPWMAYQHIYDPPGDRVLKWMIAGVIPVDSRGFPRALADSYQEAGTSGIVHNKVENLTTLFYAPDKNQLYGGSILGTLRDLEFRYTFFGLGILNIGWLLLLPQLANKQRLRTLNLPRLQIGLVISALSLAVWVVGMFGPGTTIIHQGSYLTMLLLYACLGMLFMTLRSSYIRAIAIGKIAYFGIVWIVAVYLHNHLHTVYLLWALIAILLLSYCLYKTNRLQEYTHG